MNKQHSAHNEGLCLQLQSEGKYNDWVITTAFYSAMHLVNHQLFPLVVKSKTHLNFSRYFEEEIKGKRVNKSKHQATVDLVATYLGQCYTAYKWLNDQAHFARYNNYQVSKGSADYAVKQLNRVKAICPKP